MLDSATRLRLEQNLDSNPSKRSVTIRRDDLKSLLRRPVPTARPWEILGALVLITASGAAGWLIHG